MAKPVHVHPPFGTYAVPLCGVRKRQLFGQSWVRHMSFPDLSKVTCVECKSRMEALETERGLMSPNIGWDVSA